MASYQYSQKTTNSAGQPGTLYWNVLPSGQRDEMFQPDFIAPPQQPAQPKAVVTADEALKKAREVVGVVDQDNQEKQQQDVIRLNQAQQGTANTALSYDNQGRPYIAGVLTPEQYAKAFGTEGDKKTETKTSDILDLETKAQKYIDEATVASNNLIAGLKSENATLVQNITEKYNKAIKEAEELSKTTLAGITQAGIRSGRQRYATELEVDNIAEVQRKGQDRILSLKNERDNLIAQAKAAVTNKELEQAWKLVDQKRTIEKDLRDAIQNEYKNAIDLEKAVTDKAKETRENAKSLLDMTDKISSLIAPALDKMLTGKPELDAELIKAVSSGSGKWSKDLLGFPVSVPTDLLVGALETYQGEQRKGTLTEDIKNYEYYVQQEEEAKRQPLEYDSWLTKEANRKAKATAATGIGGLTPGQITAFNSIVGKYNSSPLIQAADRVIILKNTIDSIKKDPSNGALQLNLAYSYIQALDTYQSAVREGELGLVNSIDSKIGQLSNDIQRIQNGQIVRPEVAKQIADAAEKIVNTIYSAAETKSKSFKAQAETVGLGKYWDSYVSSFEQPFNANNSFSIDYNGKKYTFSDQKTLDEFTSKLQIKK